MVRYPRIIAALVMACSLLLTVANSWAATPVGPPRIVIAGLEAYKIDGADAAMKVWLKGGPFEESKEALGQANLFRQIEAIYGKYQGYEILSSKDIGTSTQLVAVSINFEKGATYARFVLYKAQGKDWIIANMDFNTKPEVILPEYLLK